MYDELTINISKEAAKKHLDETPEPLRSIAIHSAWLISESLNSRPEPCECKDCLSKRQEVSSSKPSNGD